MSIIFPGLSLYSLILDSDSVWPGACTLVSVAPQMSLEASCLGSCALLLLMMPKPHHINGRGAFQFHFLAMAVFLGRGALRTLISLSVLANAELCNAMAASNYWPDSCEGGAEARDYLSPARSSQAL